MRVEIQFDSKFSLPLLPLSITNQCRPTNRIVLHAIKIIILNNNRRASPGLCFPIPRVAVENEPRHTNGAIDAGGGGTNEVTKQI